MYYPTIHPLRSPIACKDSFKCRRLSTVSVSPMLKSFHEYAWLWRNKGKTFANFEGSHPVHKGGLHFLGEKRSQNTAGGKNLAPLKKKTTRTLPGRNGFNGKYLGHIYIFIAVLAVGKNWTGIHQNLTFFQRIFVACLVSSMTDVYMMEFRQTSTTFILKSALSGFRKYFQFWPTKWKSKSISTAKEPGIFKSISGPKGKSRGISVMFTAKSNPSPLCDQGISGGNAHTKLKWPFLVAMMFPEIPQTRRNQQLKKPFCGRSGFELGVGMKTKSHWSVSWWLISSFVYLVASSDLWPSVKY